MGEREEERWNERPGSNNCVNKSANGATIMAHCWQHSRTCCSATCCSATHTHTAASVCARVCVLTRRCDWLRRRRSSRACSCSLVLPRRVVSSCRMLCLVWRLDSTPLAVAVLPCVASALAGGTWAASDPVRVSPSLPTSCSPPPSKLCLTYSYPVSVSIAVYHFVLPRRGATSSSGSGAASELRKYFKYFRQHLKQGQLAESRQAEGRAEGASKRPFGIPRIAPHAKPKRNDMKTIRGESKRKRKQSEKANEVKNTPN